jgi:hypothetical protein
MTEINMFFEYAHNDNLDQAAHLLQDRLSQMEMVKEVEAAPEKMRATGLEITAAIGVTVLVVRGGRELLEEIRKLVDAIKGLMVDLHDLKNVYVDLGAHRIPIDRLDQEHFRQLAKGS